MQFVAQYQANNYIRFAKWKMRKLSRTFHNIDYKSSSYLILIRIDSHVGKTKRGHLL